MNSELPNNPTGLTFYQVIVSLTFSETPSHIPTPLSPVPSRRAAPSLVNPLLCPASRVSWGSPSPSAPKSTAPSSGLRRRSAPDGASVRAPGWTAHSAHLDTGSRARKWTQRLGRFQRLGSGAGTAGRRPPAGQGQGPRPPRHRRSASADDEPRSGCQAAAAAAPRRRLHNNAARSLRGVKRPLGAAGVGLSHLPRPGADRRPPGAERAGRREGAAGPVPSAPPGRTRPLARVEGARPSPTSPGRPHLSPTSSSSAAMAAAAAAQAPSSAS